VIAVLLVGGCGGSVAPVAPLDAGTAEDAGAGSGSVFDASAGGSSGGTASDSGAGVHDGAPVGTDSGTTIDANAPHDASATDAPPPTGGAVKCPSDPAPATCDPGDFCCVVGDATQGAQTDTCEPASAPCSGTAVRCAVGADCPSNQVCCGTIQTVNGVSSYTAVSCADSCTGALQRIFCDQLASNPCPASEPTCSLSTIMPGYNVCNL
jgi:hypothetical protein